VVVIVLILMLGAMVMRIIATIEFVTIGIMEVIRINIIGSVTIGWLVGFWIGRVVH